MIKSENEEKAGHSKYRKKSILYGINAFWEFSIN